MRVSLGVAAVREDEASHERWVSCADRPCTAPSREAAIAPQSISRVEKLA
jgi:hypothetical protein